MDIILNAVTNPLPNLRFEQELWKKGFTVIGIDEVGRGAFAGPLYVGGVIFHPKSNIQYLESLGINDSKKLSPKRRKMLSEVIHKEALAFYIGAIDVAKINRVGIGKATFMAMRDVVKNLQKILESNISNIQYPNSNIRTFVLVDGFYIKYLKSVGSKNQRGIIGGDSISLSIAAASIIAKIARDKHMERLSAKYPKYLFSKNKGYGTAEHRLALKKFGPTRLHRTRFVKNFV